MSESIPPGRTERSGRRVILALASGAVVFLCVVIGVAVWMVRAAIASKPGFVSQNVPVSTSESNLLDVSLDVPPVVRGAVTDAVTHKPIPSFTLRVGTVWATGQQPQYLNQYQNPQKPQPVFSNGRYQVTLDDIIPNGNGGGWVVRVEAKGYLPMVSPVMSVGETQDFALQPSADLKGTILDPAGNPAPGVTVALVIAGDHVFLMNGNVAYSNGEKMQTGADGQFDFPPQTGKYAVVATGDAGFAQADQEALAASPQLRLAPWGRLEGLAKVGSKAIANEQVSAMYASAALSPNDAPTLEDGGAVQTDVDGHYVFERIAAGDVLLSFAVLHWHGNTFTTTSGGVRKVTVTAGQTTNMNIGSDGRTVIGRMILPAAAGDWKNYHPHGHAEPAPPTPPQMPAEIKAGNFQALQNWMDAFAVTPSGKEFMKKHPKTLVISRPLDFDGDGTFRLDDVLPGDYRINIYFSPAADGGNAPRAQEMQFTMPDITPELKDKPLEIPDIVTTMN